jgi:hypothetical protein
MISYEAPGHRGMPIMHWATGVSTFLDGTVDGGATATRIESPGATALALAQPRPVPAPARHHTGAVSRVHAVSLRIHRPGRILAS